MLDHTLLSTRTSAAAGPLWAPDLDFVQPTLDGSVPTPPTPFVIRRVGEVCIGAEPATAFQRDRAAEVWREGAPVHRPVTIVDRIENFQPRGIDERTWALVGPLVKQWVGMTGVSTTKEATRHLGVTSDLLVWCLNEGIDLREELVLHHENIDRFCDQALPDLKGGTRGSYRSMLRNIGEAVLGPDAAPHRQSLISAGDPETPYSTFEISDIYAAIQGMSTIYRRENTAVMFETVIGGGFTTTDFTGLVGTDVHLEGGGVAVYVNHGPRRRRVVLDERWEEPVARRAEAVGERPLFIPGRQRISPNDVAGFINRVHFDHLPKLTVQRLRVTWIVGRLTAGVPVHVVARAAGVRDLQLARYFRFVPDHDPADADRMLRSGRP